MKRLFVASMLLASSVASYGQEASAAAAPEPAAPEIRNWFNDPFFTLSQDFTGCPVPLGPFTGRAEMEDDAHYRVERGTTCWLAHKCTKPNSYMYDADIADAVRSRFTGAPTLHGTSIWITVQRRFIYADGCAPSAFDRDALEKQLEAVPDVEKVFIRLSTDPHAPLPYKPFPAQK
ncbi:BON domain-containing protein [Trinickia violacea]|uniref:BON domain-containing protein n=1 Tax=Trinickia violacea TaxID=2571746 RepID=A0A4P8IY48_9BURK|nr:BON domain-containing protein [Trinickia violacea]QCP52473.1 BON domain-containing protein [Trinickia violacea]